MDANIDFTIPERGALMQKFNKAATIRERIILKREATRLNHLDLVEIMLKNLIPPPPEE